MPIDALSNTIPGNAVDQNAGVSKAGTEKKNTKGTDEDSRETEKLAQRDRDVRAHEAAHMAAGGQYVKGGATFQYQKGPDGKMYAVGGEVSIDTSPVKNDPQATIMKMEAIKRAAMAPAEPSGQDRSVASAAAATEAQARQEAAKKTTSGNDKGKEPADIGLTNNKSSKKTSGYNKTGNSTPLSKNSQASVLNLLV